MKTSENNWEHRKTSKIIWHHPKNNWGPIIDDLVQFEEDFISRTKKLSGCYLRPVQFLDHLAVITMMAWYFPEISESLDLISTESTALAICVI